MVSSEIKKLGKVVVGGGKTARACDNCIRRRARWYCAADDVFLCQSCDGSVHSANPLARRHERVRLSFKHIISSLDHKPAAPPPWYQGFTKKPRTPRSGNKRQSFINPLHLVPEMEVSTVPACEQQLLYRVPELCLSENSSHEVVVKQTTPPAEADGSKVLMILPSDVESLLGKGLDEESTFAMEGLGLLDYCSRERSVMKVEVEEDDQMQTEIILLEMLREPAYDQLRFDYDDSSAAANLWEEEKEHGMCMQDHDHHLHTNILKYHDEIKKNKRILLKLDNYDGIYL